MQITSTEITIYDNGTEFTQEFQDMLQSCRTKSQSIRIENPRPNLVERIHRNLGDIIRTEHVEDVENHMREVDVLLSSFPWALRPTASTVRSKTLGQLIHNKDVIMQVAIDVSWGKTLRQNRNKSKIKMN